MFFFWGGFVVVVILCLRQKVQEYLKEKIVLELWCFSLFTKSASHLFLSMNYLGMLHLESLCSILLSFEAEAQYFVHPCFLLLFFYFYVILMFNWTLVKHVYCLTVISGHRSRVRSSCCPWLKQGSCFLWRTSAMGAWFFQVLSNM